MTEDPFCLDPAALLRGYHYEWMPERHAAGVADWGWVPAPASDFPDLPSKDGSVAYGGMVLMMIAEALLPFWSRRSERG